MRFSDMMGSGDDGSEARDGDTVVAGALTPTLTTPEPDSPVEATDAADAVEAETVETVAAEPVPAFEPPAIPAPVSILHAPPSEPIAAEFADFTPLSDDLLPRKR